MNLKRGKREKERRKKNRKIKRKRKMMKMLEERKASQDGEEIVLDHNCNQLPIMARP
jgi:hypothetical protein